MATATATLMTIDPHDRTVLIYRAGVQPRLVNINEELSGESHLPGFQVRAAEIFA